MLGLDELSSADADEVSDAIYSLSNGGGKSRALRSGEAQKTKNWRILLLSTGELPMEVKLTQGRRGSRPMAGQLARVVDIEADADKGFGIFDGCGSFDDPSALARAIASATARCYGTLGPAFIERVLALGVEQVAKRVRSEFIAPLVESLGTDVDGQVTRVAERFAVIAAAGEIAIEQGLLPWNPGDARRSAEWVFRRWLEKRGGASAPAEVRQAIETVRRFLQTHGESRFEPLDRCPLLAEEVAAPIVYNRAGWREGSGSGRRWYIPKESWADICGDLDPTLVAGALDDAGLLIGQASSGRMITKKIRGSSMRVYGLTAAALGETAAAVDEIAA